VEGRRSIGAVVEFSEWATDILCRSQQAARRFDPNATLRMARGAEGVVAFALTDEPGEGDLLVHGDGFDLLVADGLEGVVDVVEPHDRLILRPPGSTERSVRGQG
jgi:hypothetical protein